MQAFIYDEKTKELLEITELQKDPRKSALTGRVEYLYIPNSTRVAPPEFKEHEIPIYNPSNDSWTIEEDFRGLVIYDKKTGEESVVDKLGPLPKGFTLEKPIVLSDYKEEKIGKVNYLYNIEVDKDFTSYNNFTDYLKVQSSLKIKLSGMTPGDKGFISDCKGNGFMATYEEVEKLEKFYRYYFEYLQVRRSQLIKSIRKARSVSAVDKVSINFDIRDKVDELVELSNDEAEKQIQNELLGEVK